MALQSERGSSEDPISTICISGDLTLDFLQASSVDCMTSGGGSPECIFWLSFIQKKPEGFFVACKPKKGKRG